MNRLDVFLFGYRSRVIPSMFLMPSLIYISDRSSAAGSFLPGQFTWYVLSLAINMYMLVQFLHEDSCPFLRRAPTGGKACRASSSLVFLFLTKGACHANTHPCPLGWLLTQRAGMVISS